MLNSIYTTLKSDSDFVDNSSILTNLNTSEKDNLMSKLYVNKATVDFKNKNYTDCDSDLDLATKYGYNKENFSQYDDLKKKNLMKVKILQVMIKLITYIVSQMKIHQNFLETYMIILMTL